jgi:hypothetical protein
VDPVPELLRAELGHAHPQHLRLKHRRQTLTQPPVVRAPDSATTSQSVRCRLSYHFSERQAPTQPPDFRASDVVSATSSQSAKYPTQPPGLRASGVRLSHHFLGMESRTMEYGQVLSLNRPESYLTNPPGHFWRDKWTALGGPFTRRVHFQTGWPAGLAHPQHLCLKTIAFRVYGVAFSVDG